MLAFIKNKIRLHKFRKEWRKKNQDNDTLPMNCFDINAVEVGRYTYGELHIYNFNVGQKVSIGSFCSIAIDVMFVLNADHNPEHISTFPFHVDVLHDWEHEAISKGSIVIDDDVWIGYNATILSGVHIKQGAIVAAGAVVTKDVPPYAVVGGVPAKIIKFRFNPEQIKVLLNINYTKLTRDEVKKNIKSLYKVVNKLSPEELSREISWMPQK